MSIVDMVSIHARATSHPCEKSRAFPLRIGFWGTQGSFSAQVLTQLLEHYPIIQVAVPADISTATAVTLWPPPRTAPMTDELLILNRYVAPDTVQLAWQHEIPTYQVPRLCSQAVAPWLVAAALDVVCVACFPWRIPAVLLSLPTYGFLNVHPARLPAYRGPAPLFWQLRDGLRTIGVTVHWMDAAFDTGPLAAQRPLSLPTGASGAEIDQLCAATGAELLSDVLGQVAQGLLPQQPQPAGGSQHSWPTAADFCLSLQWSACHAYHFMRGTAEWQQPYSVDVAGEELLLRTAVAYTPHQTLDQPLVYSDGELLIQFQPGVLRALLW